MKDQLRIDLYHFLYCGNSVQKSKKPTVVLKDLMPESYQIIIPHGDGPMPLRVARSFVSLPLRFTILASNKSHGVHWSKLCDGQILSEPKSDEELLDQLFALERSDSPVIIMPITTEGFQFVARNRQALSQRFSLPPISETESLKTASDKWKLYDFCLKRDLPVLRSISLSNITTELLDFEAPELSFPLLIKSRNGQGGSGFRKVDNQEELTEARNAIGTADEVNFFVQRFIEGKDVSLSVFCEKGEIKSYTFWQAITYGKSKYQMPVCVQFGENEQVLSIGQRLLRTLNWEGICDIDFFVDENTQEIWLLEINARFWGTVVACKIAGVDFTDLMCKHALSKGDLEWPKQRPGAVYCHPEGLLKSLKGSEVRAQIIRHPLKTTGMNNVLRDLGPNMYHFLAGTKWKLVQFLAGFKKDGLKKRWRHVLGIFFIGLQLFSIGYARFIPERFFCWAPYDEHTIYKMVVEVDGRELNHDEIEKRYRYPATAWEVRAIRNVISLVRQYESTYGKSDQAEIKITFETNGHSENIWIWPET